MPLVSVLNVQWPSSNWPAVLSYNPGVFLFITLPSSLTFLSLNRLHLLFHIESKLTEVLLNPCKKFLHVQNYPPYLRLSGPPKMAHLMHMMTLILPTCYDWDFKVSLKCMFKAWCPQQHCSEQEPLGSNWIIMALMSLTERFHSLIHNLMNLEWAFVMKMNSLWFPWGQQPHSNGCSCLYCSALPKPQSKRVKRLCVEILKVAD